MHHGDMGPWGLNHWGCWHLQDVKPGGASDPATRRGKQAPRSSREVAGDGHHIVKHRGPQGLAENDLLIDLPPKMGWLNARNYRYFMIFCLFVLFLH